MPKRTRRSIGVFALLAVAGLQPQIAQPVFSESVLPVIDAGEIGQTLNSLPDRAGPPPITPDGIPHQQYSQNAPPELQLALREAVSALPGLLLSPTPFSLAGSVGWRLEEGFAGGPSGAFIRDTREFGHQHRPSDGSMHLLLPDELSRIALEKSWGVMHPASETISGAGSEYVMIYGPRDASELESIWVIALASYYQARGL